MAPRRVADQVVGALQDRELGAQREQLAPAGAGRAGLVASGVGPCGRRPGAGGHRKASMSATVLGMAAVSTSWPVAVTSTSSSMRTPMPRQRASTRSSSGGDVEAGLDRQHHARLERARLLVGVVGAARRARRARASGSCGACRSACSRRSRALASTGPASRPSATRPSTSTSQRDLVHARRRSRRAARASIAASCACEHELVERALRRA